MTKPFDMGAFLSGVLTSSKLTQQRHLRQAKIMQAAIQLRWQQDNAWVWQLKHLRWFFAQNLKNRSYSTRYYCRLTTLIIYKRLGKNDQMLIDWLNTQK